MSWPKEKILPSEKHSSDLGVLINSMWRTVKNAVGGLLSIFVCVLFFSVWGLFWGIPPAPPRPTEPLSCLSD